MAQTVDWIIGSIVIVVGLVIFYRMLKDPIDTIFGWIGDLFGWGVDKMRDSTRSEKITEITFG